MIVQCEKCGNEHDGTYATGRFCGEQCARSFASLEKRKEINEKVSAALKGRSFLSQEQRAEGGRKSSATKIAKLMESDFETLKPFSKKRRVILEQKGACLICGITEWMGKPLTLSVDHEDGNNQNNRRENLRGLCPNCHSQTETFCGKNRGCHHKKGQPRVTDERLLAALLATRSISEGLRSVGMNRSYLAYKRCKDLLQHHALECAVDSRFAFCGFCQTPLGVPYEEGVTRFCSSKCTGSYRAFVKHGKVLPT